MDKALYVAMTGARASLQAQGTVSHNIANAETVGFKKSSVQFADLVATGSATDPRRAPGIGATIAGITQDFVLGPLEQTGRSLDLAIDGDGFFALENPFSGDLSFTRNGNFQLRAEILRRVNLVAAPGKVDAVLIEEMLVQ